MQIVLPILILCLLLGCKTPSTAENETPMDTGTVELSLPLETPAPTPETVEVGGQVFDLRETAVTLSLGSLAEAEDAVSQFPDLLSVTLLAPALTPDEYRAFTADFPDLAIDCGIQLGGQTVSVHADALDLSAADLPDWTDVLSLFPSLRVLTLGEASPSEVRDVLAADPGLSVSFLFHGQPVNAEITELDFNGTAVPTAAELDALYALAPQLASIRIDDPDESAQKELAAFDPRAKGVTLHCNLTLLDRTVAADAETVDFGDRILTDEEAYAVEAALPLFTNLREIDLYESRLSQETMDTLFDAHPDLFFGWTFGIWDDFFIVRSDATAFSSGTGQPGFHRWLLTEDDFKNLRFCKGLQALDLGHNAIKNLEFLRNWPHMKVLILADTCVTDLSVLAELTELEYLELFLTTPDSYEPLTHLPNLLDLNLCHTKKEGKQYRDNDEILLLTQIKSLERLWISKTLTAEQAQLLRDGLPGVEFDFSSPGSTDNGWRTHPRYFIMRKGFKTHTYIPFE